MAASKTSVKKGALTGTPVASAKAPEETAGRVHVIERLEAGGGRQASAGRTEP